MQPEKGVGVIVGRFQVAELTEGHKEIFEHVLSKAIEVITVEHRIRDLDKEGGRKCKSTTR